MARVNYETLGTLINIDDKDLEFERVTNSIDVVDREYGVEPKEIKKLNLP